MSKIDLAKFHDSIRGRFAFTGRRVATFNHDTQQGCDVDGSPMDAGIVAGAIAMTLLLNLRDYAEVKALTAKDLQIAIDAFFERSGLAEHHTPMGGLTYRWRED